MALSYLRSGLPLKVLCLTPILLVILCLCAIVDSHSATDIVYVYDELGRLIAVIDPSTDAAVYRYDEVGNLLSISRYSAAIVSVIEFTPNSGVVGTPVTIYGTGFRAIVSQNSVSFNGVSGVVTSSTSTQIIAPAPYTAADVAVTDLMAIGDNKTVTSVTDALTHQTTIAYNAAGQPTSIKADDAPGSSDL